jgi:branched-chain amino acid transport system substrate-binding protein
MSLRAWSRSLLFVAMASAVSLTGCKGKAASNELLVGHYASMTGSEATFGQSTDNGIKLAVEEFNASSAATERKVKLITYDDQGIGQEASAAVSRLVSHDGVHAVLGEVASSLSLNGADVCQAKGVPMISPSSTNEKVTQKGDMIFRVCFIDPFQAYVCAKFAREHEPLKASKAAILFDQKSAYSEGLQKEFEKHFTAMGGTITSVEAFTAGDQDFTAQLTSIREKSPDVVFLPAYYTDVANVVVQARKLSMTMPFLGGDGWDSDKLVEIAGTAIEGCYYSNHYSQQDPSPRVQEFITKYKAKFGSTPDGLAALGYDAARILFEAVGRSKSLGGTDLAAAIAQTKDFDGVTGKITIDANRNALKPAVIIELKGGQRSFVTTIDDPTR